jgi:hypothetical protein
MSKKNKEMKIEPSVYSYTEGVPLDNQREVKKFKPTEWAKQEGLDPHLFLYWENQLMGEQEYKEIKKKVM